MKIDLSKMKHFWFELEDGTKVDVVPRDYKGYVTYHHCFPCELTEKVDSFIFQPRRWHEKVLLNVFPRLRRKWDVTKGRKFKRAFEFNTTYNAMSDVIVAMVNSGDYTLEQAIWICAKSCERCMNVLANKYLGEKEGYAEFSDEWHKCNTVCQFCENESGKSC